MEFKRFRPLSGSYISQSKNAFFSTYYQVVSVPYRGAIFLNDCKRNQRIKGGKSFRPLSGSYISQ